MHIPPIFPQSALMCPVNSQCRLMGGLKSTPITECEDGHRDLAGGQTADCP